jgi:hypothetical protein
MNKEDILLQLCWSDGRKDNKLQQENMELELYIEYLLKEYQVTVLFCQGGIVNRYIDESLDFEILIKVNKKEAYYLVVLRKLLILDTRM